MDVRKKISRVLDSSEMNGKFGIAKGKGMCEKFKVFPGETPPHKIEKPKEWQ